MQRTAEQDLFGTNTLKLNASADALDQPLAAESRAASLRKEATERLEELAKDEDLSNATSNSTLPAKSFVQARAQGVRLERLEGAKASAAAAGREAGLAAARAALGEPVNLN